MPLLDTPRAMRWFVWGTHLVTAAGLAMAVALLGFSAIGAQLRRPELWLTVILIELADLYLLVPWMRDVRGRIRLHWSGAFALALALICGPATVVLFPLIALGALSTMRSTLWRRLFNVSVMTLEALVGFGVLYLIFGPWPADPGPWTMLLAGAVAGILWNCVNMTMVCTAMTLFDGTPVKQTLMFGIRRTGPWLAALAASPTVAYVVLHAPELLPGLALLTVLVHHSVASNIRRSDEARTDQLTGLANRTAALEHLDQLLQSRRYVGETLLMMIDLDGFKLVNDTHGHDAGDLVLTDVAARIRQAVPAELVVARLGGDEFLVLGESTDRSTAVAGAISAAIERPMTLPNGAAVSLTCSIGAVNAAPGTQAIDVLRNADQKMYQAKLAAETRAPSSTT